MDARPRLRSPKPISGYQFAAFRIALGLYLAVRFARLATDAVPSVELSFAVALSLLSVVFALGYARQQAAVLLGLGAACFFDRSHLFVLLLLCALVPAGEPLVPSRLRREDWFFPLWVFRAAWILLAVGYAHTGLDELLAPPSFRNASALTWSTLTLELVFLPLACFRRTRPWIWLAMAGMHAGIAELSIGMLLVHAFTFDPAWLPPPRDQARRLVLFDGVCVLCDSSMRFLLAEDRGELLSFAPLQGRTAREVLARHPDADRSLSTVLYVRSFEGTDERVHARSQAAFLVLDDIGGFWRVVSWLRFVPRPIRDGLYQWVATNRYRWFGKLDECRLPGSDEEKRFLL